MYETGFKLESAEKRRRAGIERKDRYGLGHPDIKVAPPLSDRLIIGDQVGLCDLQSESRMNDRLERY
jgi:hypothetical protein